MFETLYFEGKSKKTCLIIPVINEGKRLISFIQRLYDQRIFVLCDIIIVDGGSVDGSISRYHLALLNVRGVITMTNKSGGLSAQLRAAYSFSIDTGYQYFITIDGNNKDDPAAIPLFIDYLINGYDFVQASRFIKGGLEINTPLIRLIAIKLIHAPILSLASGFNWSDTTQGFRGYSRNLLTSSKVAPLREFFVGYSLLAYMSFIAPRKGFKCIEVPTTRAYPSGIVPTKINSISHFLNLFLTLIMASTGRYNP